MSNDEKQLTEIADEICNSLGESRMAVLCALRRGTVIAYEQARAEVIEEVRDMLRSYSRAYESKSPTGQIMRSYVDWNDIEDALTKLSRGAE